MFKEKAFTSYKEKQVDYSGIEGKGKKNKYNSTIDVYNYECSLYYLVFL
jgi:hypothetical protein